MKDNLRIILYALAAGIAFMLWQKWQLAEQPKTTTTTTSQSQNSNTSVPAYTETQSGDAAIPNGGQVNSGELVHVKTDRYDIEIDTRGASIVSTKLLGYKTSTTDDEALALIHTENPDRMLFEAGIVSQNKADSATHFSTWSAEGNNYSIADGENSVSVPFTFTSVDGIKITKTFIFYRDKYVFDITQQVKNDSTKDWNGFAYQQIAFGASNAPKGLGHVATFTGFATSTPDNHYKKIKLENIASGEETVNQKVNSGWVAMMRHYFVGALVPEQGKDSLFYTQYDNGDHIIGIRDNTATVVPGSSQTFTTKAYLGPKIEQDLSPVAPYLDKTIDYGWLFMISQIMFKVMSAIYTVIGNWGWAIVVMTLFIKLIFFIPSAWAYKSMAKMRALQPEMAALKDKFGGDRQAISQNMMKLYRENKVNPASGCLPMLLQIPFFIAFYWVLAESAELRMAPWILWIQDLSLRDPYYILPIINAGLMFLQQKLNPPPPDPTQAKIMMMLPLIFGFMFMWFPAGLVLYWTVSNGFSIIQQYVMNKRYGTPLKPHNQHKKAKA